MIGGPVLPTRSPWPEAALLIVALCLAGWGGVWLLLALFGPAWLLRIALLGVVLFAVVPPLTLAWDALTGQGRR